MQHGHRQHKSVFSDLPATDICENVLFLTVNVLSFCGVVTETGNMSAKQ